MKKKNYRVLGVMSGTSLDGIDLAECIFEVSDAGSWNFQIGQATTIPYSETYKGKLKRAVGYSEKRLRNFNDEYTWFLGLTIERFIRENNLKDIDAVCSHGHTILHQPDKGITLQIGNGPSIATYAEQKVVCDFRVQDVALGGQGAPLVPIGDRLLFGTYDYCLNLGGFANISSEKEGERIAYDVCPVNIVLNPLAEKLGLPYDDSGKLAALGNLDMELFEQLNTLPFYEQAPPKSLGLEWVQEHVFPLLRASNASVHDQLHTVTEHVAWQLSDAFVKGSSVLVTGGGAYNTYLLQRVQYHKDLKLVVPDPTLVEYKEALVFGLLGVLKLRKEVNCMSSVTGAKRDHSSGLIYEY